jgi:hypothetical protein
VREFVISCQFPPDSDEETSFGIERLKRPMSVSSQRSAVAVGDKKRPKQVTELELEKLEREEAIQTAKNAILSSANWIRDDKNEHWRKLAVLKSRFNPFTYATDELKRNHNLSSFPLGGMGQLVNPTLGNGFLDFLRDWIIKTNQFEAEGLLKANLVIRKAYVIFTFSLFCLGH